MRQSSENGRFETSDGTNIWYQTFEGTGPVTYVLCDGVACDGYIWKYFIPYFAGEAEIIHAQYRGHGRSDVPQDLKSLTVEQFAADILELLQELDRSEQTLVFVGHSMGVQVALECYRQAPQHVRGLILINGPYGEALKHVHSTPLFAKALPGVQKLVDRWQNYVEKVWQPLLDSEPTYLLALAFEVNPWLTQRKDFRVYFKTLGEMPPKVYLAALEGANQHTAEDILAEVKVPTLVVAGDKDRFTPYPVCLRLYKKIPGAELMTMPTGSHIGPLELPELLHLRIEKFVRTHFTEAENKTKKATKGARPAKEAAKVRPAAKASKGQKKKPR